MKYPIQRENAVPRRSPQSPASKDGLVLFVFQRGMLRIGVALFAVSTLYIYYYLGDHTIIERSRVIFTVPSCLLIGCLWGLHAWHSARRAEARD